MKSCSAETTVPLRHNAGSAVEGPTKPNASGGTCFMETHSNKGRKTARERKACVRQREISNHTKGTMSEENVSHPQGAYRY